MSDSDIIFSNLSGFSSNVQSDFEIEISTSIR